MAAERLSRCCVYSLALLPGRVSVWKDEGGSILERTGLWVVPGEDRPPHIAENCQAELDLDEDQKTEEHATQEAKHPVGSTRPPGGQAVHRDWVPEH
jgi:hypothetical protein